MSFEIICATMIALFIGTIICFGGYRFFLFLLPIWGFFFGLGLGAHSIQLLLGDAFFGTITSWVVGFVVGVIFAVLSYLFYAVAVAVIAGSLGYGLGVGIMHWIFNTSDTGIIIWLVGVVAAVVMILLTLRFSLAKWIIIIATSMGGAAAVVGVLALGLEGFDFLTLVGNPIQTIFDASFWWALFYLVLAGFGIMVQYMANRAYTIEEYNRYASM